MARLHDLRVEQTFVLTSIKGNVIFQIHIPTRRPDNFARLNKRSLDLRIESKFRNPVDVAEFASEYLASSPHLTRCLVVIDQLSGVLELICLQAK